MPIMQKTDSNRTASARRLSKTIAGVFSILYFGALACVIGYVWWVAQDAYITSATFKITKQESTSSGETGLAQLALPGMTDNGSVDSQIVIGFVASADLLLDLEKEFKLREHYASPPVDFFFRLDADAPLEKRLNYYREHITATFDAETGLTLLTVQTFEPELARKIAASVLQKAEAFVNRLNQSIADQQLESVKSEVQKSVDQVAALSGELLELQNEHNVISPDEAVSASLTAVREMRMERLRADAQLVTLLRDSPNSPRIDNIRSRLRSLDELIAQEVSKLSGPEQDRLNQIVARFKELQMKLDFAISIRSGAQLLLEKTRVEAVSRSRFFSVLQHPYVPEEVAMPKRGYATATLLVLGFLLFLILRALLRSVFERG